MNQETFQQNPQPTVDYSNMTPNISEASRRPKNSRKFFLIGLVVLVFLIGGTTTFFMTHRTEAYSVPGGIARDCSKDVTKQLTDWIKSLPNGTPDAPTVIDLGSGTCYGLGAAVPSGVNPTSPQTYPKTGEWSGIVLSSRQYLKITGDANKKPELRTLIDAPRYPDPKASNGINRGQLWIDGGNNISISNIIFTGRNSKGGYNPSNRQEYDHNLRIVGASRVTVDNVVAQKSNGDGIAVLARGPWTANGKGAVPSTYVTIKNSRLSGNGRQGITVQNGSNITITQNNFNDQYYWPIDLEQHLPLHSIKKITISKNTVTGKTPYGFINLATQNLLTDTADGQNQGSSDITVDSNVFSANSSSCLEFMTINGAQTTNKNQAPTRGITIVNNTMNINQYAVKVNNASGLMVKGNKGTTRTTNSLCAANDSSNAADKVFGMVAAGNNVRDVKIRENSFLRRPGDSERIKTDSFVQVWNAGTKTGAVAGLENCSNNTTQSKNATSYDQPTICSSSTVQPEAPFIQSPSQNETIVMARGETTSEVKIKGKARPSVSVNISVALGDRVVSNQIVGSDSAGLWSASAILPAGVYRMTVTQTIGSSISSSLTQQFVVSGADTDTPTRPDVRPPITPPVTTNPTDPQTPPDSSSRSLAVLAPSEGQGMQTPNVSTRMLVTVSGKAKPGNYVVVSVGTVSQKVRVSDDGKWFIRLTLSIGRYTAHVIELSGAKTVGIADRQFSVVQ